MDDTIKGEECGRLGRGLDSVRSWVISVKMGGGNWDNPIADRLGGGWGRQDCLLDRDWVPVRGENMSVSKTASHGISMRKVW